LGEGDDVGVGGNFNDIIYGDNGRDIVVGDAAKIDYYPNSTSPKLITSIDCIEGGDDTLYGGNGTVDYIIGGAYNDTIQGNDGMDLVFGDHALIKLYENESHKLLFAQTILEYCAGGDDNITLGLGDDMAFGGAYNDYIEGNDGQDVILGDFGLFDATIEFLPNLPVLTILLVVRMMMF